ncbi:hypothetical protein KY312_04455 [Candidatus Woesearchaeota archaeon]|nr:hypothetical protein [Candidatus Woesearchaeota archaeon]
MVHLETMRFLRNHLQANFMDYVEAHPGEYILLERNLSDIKETFYETKEQFDKSLKKYKGKIGCTFLTEHIPVKTHRFNKNNETLEIRLDEHVTVCPNDNETELIGMNPVQIEHRDGRYRYKEQAYCPDCGYKVFRKCSAETAKQAEENMRRLVIK